MASFVQLAAAMRTISSSSSNSGRMPERRPIATTVDVVMPVSGYTSVVTYTRI